MAELLVDAVPQMSAVEGLEGEITEQHGTLVTELGELPILMQESTPLARALTELIQDAVTTMQEGLEQASLKADITMIDHNEVISIDQEIETLQQAIEGKERPTETRKSAMSEPRGTETNTAPKTKTYQSLFSMAKTLSQTATGKKAAAPNQKSATNEVTPKAVLSAAVKPQVQEQLHKYDTERPESRERDGRDGEQQQEQEKERQKKRAREALKKIARKKVSVRIESSQAEGRQETLQGIGNIFTRFMQLMARILGQAEAEAHTLYNKIKQRTDDVDTLTSLLGKINSNPGSINWENDEEMKVLLEKARAIGVEIPEGKYAWDESDRHLLKENIQMRKDSMEKITQLERTDMQRYLQEASQCHQARSNVLKLLKEVMDTIVHNMRP